MRIHQSLSSLVSCWDTILPGFKRFPGVQRYTQTSGDLSPLWRGLITIIAIVFVVHLAPSLIHASATPNYHLGTRYAFLGADYAALAGRKGVV